jgi:hypothetical protein
LAKSSQWSTNVVLATRGQVPRVPGARLSFILSAMKIADHPCQHFLLNHRPGSCAGRIDEGVLPACPQKQTFLLERHQPGLISGWMATQASRVQHSTRAVHDRRCSHLMVRLLAHGWCRSKLVCRMGFMISTITSTARLLIFPSCLLAIHRSRVSVRAEAGGQGPFREPGTVSDRR